MKEGQAFKKLPLLESFIQPQGRKQQKESPKWYSVVGRKEFFKSGFQKGELMSTPEEPTQVWYANISKPGCLVGWDPWSQH